MSDRRPPPRRTPAPASAPRGQPPRAPSEPPAFSVDPSSAQKFYSEPPTKQKNVTASVYQSLLSVFDEMTAEQRMEFVDLASRYASLDGPGRYDTLEIVSAFASLDDAARAHVLELVRDLVRPTRS